MTVWTRLTQISGQLERWQLLPDSALCERVVAYLDVDITPRSLEDQNSHNLYHVAQLLSAVARKSTRVETTLRLDRRELNSTLALTGILFPRVCRVIASNCSEGLGSNPSDSWSLILGGRSFPDLRQLETDGFPRESRDPRALSLTMAEQLACAEDAVHKSRDRENIQTDVSLEGSKYLQTLKIEGDATLNQPLLLFLLGSAHVPTRLTTREIAYCPNLLFAKTAATWSKLL